MPLTPERRLAPLLPRYRLFLALVMLLGFGTAVAFGLTSPHNLVYPIIITPLLCYLIIMRSEYRPDETPESYFLSDRKMPFHQYTWTFVVSNVGLFSSIAFSTVLAYYYGIPGMVYTVLAWFLGIYLFSKQVPKLLPFLKKGHTLHEFIAQHYGANEHERSQLRSWASAATLLLYWASLSIEVKFGADVLAPTFGDLSSITVAVFVALTALTYMYFAGYRGVVRTDAFQFWVMSGGLLLVIYHLISLCRSSGFSLPSSFFSPRNILLGPDPYGLFAILVLLIPYQFCVMDMWQRSIAVAGESPSLSDEQLVQRIQRAAFRDSLLPFMYLFLCWFAIGLVVLSLDLTDDPNQILPAFLATAHEGGVIGHFLEAIIALIFLSAVISTVDSFLIALVQTFMYDIYATRLVRGLVERLPHFTSRENAQFVNISRLLVVFFGVTGVFLAFVGPIRIIYFWVGMYSLMLVLFPSVLYGIRGASPGPNSFTAAFRSIFWAFLATLFAAIVGTFVYPNAWIANSPPLLALGLAFVIFWANDGHHLKGSSDA